MSLELLPESCQLSWFAREGTSTGLIPFKGSVLVKDSRIVDLKRMVYGLAQDWPEPARGIAFVSASRRVSRDMVAEARVSSFSTVSGQIEISRRALRDPGLDALLLGLQSTGWSIGQTLADVLVHEWGHLLVHMAILLRYKSHFQDGFNEFTQLIEERSDLSVSDAAFELCGRAQLSNNELFAEAFTDAYLNRSKAQHFSKVIFAVLGELWAPEKYWSRYVF